MFLLLTRSNFLQFAEVQVIMTLKVFRFRTGQVFLSYKLSQSWWQNEAFKKRKWKEKILLRKTFLRRFMQNVIPLSFNCLEIVALTFAMLLKFQTTIKFFWIIYFLVKIAECFPEISCLQTWPHFFHEVIENPIYKRLVFGRRHVWQICNT